MNDGTEDRDSERPWRTAIQALPLPAATAEAKRLLEELQEIKAHREWVIDGLRAHISNIESDLKTALERIGKLEAHTANLEKFGREVAKHASNLASELELRDARIAACEDHAANLERKLGHRSVDFRSPGIFPSSSLPRLAALFRIGEQIRAARPDLVRRYPAQRAADYWYWLMWQGGALHPDFDESGYELPDAFLRQRVVGSESVSDTAYTRSGLVDWATIDTTLREAGFDPLAGGKLLDFGSGCGRVLQHFALYSGNCELTGADVDRQAVSWCRKHLDFARFEHLPLEPPSSFADGEFDAVYAFSVFSHLTEQRCRAWLEELHRILRPGGALVLTLQGRRVIRAVMEGTWPGAFPSPEELEPRIPTFEREGFLFFPYESAATASDPAPAANGELARTLDFHNYGSTFVSESYVRRNWTDLFEVIAFHEAPDDWQDYLALERTA